MSLLENGVAATGPLRGPLRKRESHLWDRHPDDWYVEPRWVSERLFEEERFRGGICDPACGMGNIVLSALARGFKIVEAADIAQRSPTLMCAIRDWMMPGDMMFDNIVCNPPFKLCDDRKSKNHPWVERCLERARFKVALLMPANWVQGEQRSRWLERSPLAKVYFIAPRPSMPPGPAVEAGVKPGNGTTDYAWFVWLHGHEGPPTIKWLRRDDWPDAAANSKGCHAHALKEIRKAGVASGQLPPDPYDAEIAE